MMFYKHTFGPIITITAIPEDGNNIYSYGIEGQRRFGWKKQFLPYLLVFASWKYNTEVGCQEIAPLEVLVLTGTQGPKE